MGQLPSFQIVKEQPIGVFREEAPRNTVARAATLFADS